MVCSSQLSYLKSKSVTLCKVKVTESWEGFLSLLSRLAMLLEEGVTQLYPPMSNRRMNGSCQFIENVTMPLHALPPVRVFSLRP